MLDNLTHGSKPRTACLWRTTTAMQAMMAKAQQAKHKSTQTCNAVQSQRCIQRVRLYQRAPPPPPPPKLWTHLIHTARSYSPTTKQTVLQLQNNCALQSCFGRRFFPKAKRIRLLRASNLLWTSSRSSPRKCLGDQGEAVPAVRAKGPQHTRSAPALQVVRSVKQLSVEAHVAVLAAQPKAGPEEEHLQQLQLSAGDIQTHYFGV